MSASQSWQRPLANAVSFDDGVLMQQISNCQQLKKVLCRFFRIERIVAKIDNPWRYRQPAPVDQLALVAIEGQNHPRISGCTLQHLWVLCARSLLDDSDNILSCCSQVDNAGQGEILVSQESHRPAPLAS